MRASKGKQLLLGLSLVALYWAHYVSAGTAGAAIAPPANSALPGDQSTTNLPPLIAALTALRDPDFSFRSNISFSTKAAGAATSSSAMGRATATPAGLDSLRPAAAAALARKHSDPSAPLTADDITAINILLSREGPASDSYCYDTGLPAVPHLVSFGNHSTSSSRSGSSMLSNERLGRLSGLGPLSWLARSYAVTGDTLLKLRITQQLQFILQDAISDSLASSANMPPNQVVTFASSNLSFSLGFTGVDWDDGMPADGTAARRDAAAAVAELPHKGLEAVKRALQHLTGNFDPGHTTVSFQPLSRPRGVPRSAAAMAGKAYLRPRLPLQPAGTTPPVAATNGNTARKLLLAPPLPFHGTRQQGSSGRSSSRRLSSNSRSAELTVVYVQMHGMDPMNMTSLMERLGNCSARLQQEGGPKDGRPLQPQQAASGQMPDMTPGRPLRPLCTEIFKQELQQAGVPVASDPSFSVAPFEKPQASISIAVAVGLTRDQQMTSDTDAKAGNWLNSTAMQDILGTFNLSVTTTDKDYVSYLRDPDSGRFPPLPGLNLTSLIPSLFQTVLAAGRNMSQQQQPQEQPQALLVPSATAAFNKSILAGIIVAVVASVLALLGVVVLLLRRRSDSRANSGQQDDPEAGEGAGSRRRRRRPRVYHTKYLSDAAPVTGHTPQQQPGSSAAAPSTAAAAAAAAAGPSSLRHALERGDSVMSQVNAELDEAAQQDDDDDSSETAGSTSALMTPTQNHHHQQQQQQQQQQHRRQHWLRPLERQQGEAGSSGSNSMQALLTSMQPTSSNASSAVSVIPADAAAWDDAGSASCHTVCVDLATNSSSLSTWASQQEGQGAAGTAAAAAAGGSDPKLSSRAVGRHRLAVTSQADGAGVQEPQQGSVQQQQQQQEQQEQQEQVGSASAHPAQQQVVPPRQAAANSVDGGVSPASAFAAMDAQLTAARAGAARHSAGSHGGGAGGSSGGGSNASAEAIQPLGQSCWHKGSYASGFIVPEAAAAGTGSSSSGDTQQASQRRPGGLVSPFAAAIQLAHSVASDEV